MLPLSCVDQDGQGRASACAALSPVFMAKTMMKPEKLTIAEKAWSKVGWLVAHHSWKVLAQGFATLVT